MAKKNRVKQPPAPPAPLVIPQVGDVYWKDGEQQVIVKVDFNVAEGRFDIWPYPAHLVPMKGDMLVCSGYWRCAGVCRAVGVARLQEI